MEFIAVPPPRTPRMLKKPESPPQGPGSPKEDPLLLDMVRSFESVEREEPAEPPSPGPHYRALSSPGGWPRAPQGERTLVTAPGSLSPLQPPLHPTLLSFAHDEKLGAPKEEGACPPAACPPTLALGSPNCVKSRGRFPMMGIGQMLRKRHQSLQPALDRPLEASLPPLQPVATPNLSFGLADGVRGQC